MRYWPKLVLVLGLSSLLVGCGSSLDDDDVGAEGSEGSAESVGKADSGLGDIKVDVKIDVHVGDSNVNVGGSHTAPPPPRYYCGEPRHVG